MSWEEMVWWWKANPSFDPSPSMRFPSRLPKLRPARSADVPNSQSNREAAIRIWKKNWYFYVVTYNHFVQRGMLKRLKWGLCQWSGVARSHLWNVLLRNRPFLCSRDHVLVQSLEIKPNKANTSHFSARYFPRYFPLFANCTHRFWDFFGISNWRSGLTSCNTHLPGWARPRPGEPTPRRLWGTPWLTTAEGDLCFKKQDSLTSVSPATLYLSETVTRDSQLDCWAKYENLRNFLPLLQEKAWPSPAASSLRAKRQFSAREEVIFAKTVTLMAVPAISKVLKGRKQSH